MFITRTNISKIFEGSKSWCVIRNKYRKQKKIKIHEITKMKTHDEMNSSPCESNIAIRRKLRNCLITTNAENYRIKVANDTYHQTSMARDFVDPTKRSHTHVVITGDKRKISSYCDFISRPQITEAEPESRSRTESSSDKIAVLSRSALCVFSEVSMFVRGLVELDGPPLPQPCH